MKRKKTSITKKIKSYIKKLNVEYKNWWVMCIYIFVPLFVVMTMNNELVPKIIEKMSKVEVEGAMIINSSYAINKVIIPFAESFVLVFGFMISYLILALIQRLLLKNKKYFIKAKQFLKFSGCITVLMVLVIAIYSKTNSFEYDQYGYNIETLKGAVTEENTVQYVVLEEIPSINSIGVQIKGSNLSYNIALKISQFLYSMSENFELVIAFAGAVILPLQNYVEAIEQLDKTRSTCL